MYEANGAPYEAAPFYGAALHLGVARAGARLGWLLVLPRLPDARRYDHPGPSATRVYGLSLYATRILQAEGGRDAFQAFLDGAVRGDAECAYVVAAVYERWVDWPAARYRELVVDRARQALTAGFPGASLLLARSETHALRLDELVADRGDADDD
jgi:hypothetical protein